MIRELIKDEINSVSGGNANSNYEGGMHGIGYGAQADGFQPNSAAAGHGLMDDLKNPCVAAVASGAVGIAGAVASRSPSGIATAVGSAAIGIGSTCPDTSHSNHSNDGPPFR